MAKTPPTTKKSPFLDTLPPELRLRVYSHLLVAPEPIKGPSARGTTRYGLSTAILRVNRQINAEARSAFFGKNTFYITSVRGTRCPSPSPNNHEDAGEEEEEGTGAFSPPLQLHDLPLVRHLEIDPLFYPTRQPSSSSGAGAKTPCLAAQRYVLNLAYLLALVRPSLRSLSFTADARPYAVPQNEEGGEGDDEGEDGALNIPKLLTSFHVIEGHVRFRKAVAELAAVKHIAVSFFFPESEFCFEVEKGELCRRGLLFLACQTVFARSEIGVRALLEGLGDDDGVEDDGLGAFDGARRGSLVAQEVR